MTVSVVECASLYFAEPLPWMGVLEEIEGKLHCPGCKGKIGHWHWQGSQCSCGYIL